MKHFKSAALLILLCLAAGCVDRTDDTQSNPNLSYHAVILDRGTFNNSVKALPPQNMVRSGKIYVKDQYMFINDVNLGFHVYDYSDPQNPVQKGFIQAPGATDLAIRGNNFYINQAVDLITINYDVQSNTLNLTKRNTNVFPQKLAPDGSYGTISGNQVIVDWTSN